MYNIICSTTREYDQYEKNSYRLGADALFKAIRKRCRNGLSGGSSVEDMSETVC